MINQHIQQRMKKTHSARCILYSVDFEETIQQHLHEWDVIAGSYIEIARRLELAGCDFIALCANTPHKIADKIQNEIHIPLIHIVDATAEKIQEKKIKKIGLIGTKYTMGEPFYIERLKERYDIEAIVPEKKDQIIIHDIIFNELTYEIMKKSSKEKYLSIIDRLKKNGAEGIILGCTEIPLLISQDDLDIPSFDTTVIHAKAIAEYALQ